MVFLFETVSVDNDQCLINVSETSMKVRHGSKTFSFFLEMLNLLNRPLVIATYKHFKKKNGPCFY